MTCKFARRYHLVPSILFAIMFAQAVASPLCAGEPFVIFKGQPSSIPHQPQAHMSADGIVHLTFGIGEQVYYCNVNGEKASAAQIAFKVPNMSLGMRRGPRIAKVGKSIVITAIGGTQGKGRDGDILAYSSEDEGQTWTGPVRVNDVESSAREGLHAMTAANGKDLWCVWLDLRDKGTKLFASKSSDGGKSWKKNTFVYRSPDGSICECCHPSIAADGNSIHVLFRNSLGGNRDMYLVSSNDQGETFETAQRLGNQQWKLNACPMDGGMLALTSKGEVVTTWRRGSTIFVTEQQATSETSLGAGEQPWIATNRKGTYITWVTKRAGDLMLAAPNSSTPVKIATQALDPVITASTTSEPSVHLFWEQRNGDQIDIMGRSVD